MKRIFFLLSFLSIVVSCYSQNISVSSFKILDTDLTANTAGTMETDQNGETAALIKVVTTQTGFAFDGGALGIVKTVQKPSEIWVYVPRGLKKITISHPQLGMLRDYYLTIPIEAARTYEMVLISGEVQTIVKQQRTSQYVVFQLNPPEAVVELNGELLKTENGIASKMMKFGTYNYRVQAPNYLLEAGSVTIDDPDSKKIVNISLKPNYAQVKIEVEDNAEIWINGEKKGVGSWSGNLGAGIYEIEAQKEGHRRTSTTQEFVVSSEPQIIKLQKPIPVYGEADINSSPGMADIYIDGKKMGQTPLLLSNLLIGNHKLSIIKEGYEIVNKTLEITESETKSVSIQLKKKQEESKQNIVLSNNNSHSSAIKNNSPLVQKYHDVECNEAKGPVKSMTTEMMGDSRTINFSEDGKMQSAEMSDAVYNVNGYLQSAKMSVQGQNLGIKFAWENGRLKSQTINMMGQDIKTSFNYDENGVVKSQAIDMGGQVMESTYTEYKFDDHGNWISRKASMMGQEIITTRSFTYYN